MLRRDNCSETNQETYQNETTPLNILATHQPTQTTDRGNTVFGVMDNDTKRILIKIAIDLVLLGCGELCTQCGRGESSLIV